MATFHIQALESMQTRKVVIPCLSTQSCSWISFPDSSIITIPLSVSSMRRVEELSRFVATVVVFIFCTQYFETSFDGDSPHSSRLYRYIFFNVSVKILLSNAPSSGWRPLCRNRLETYQRLWEQVGGLFSIDQNQWPCNDFKQQYHSNNNKKLKK